MGSKFSQVPIEEDTKILFQQEAKLGEFDVFYQKWFWDGITGESIIFANEDVAQLGDSDIEENIKESPLLKEGSRITLKRSESGFTYVNFNFETEHGFE